MSARVTSDWSPIYADIRGSAAEADQDTRADAERRAAKLSGRYAARFRAVPQTTSGDVVTGGVTNDAPQAGVLEQGYDAGPRRGPHLGAQPALGPAGDQWGQHFEQRLEARAR